MFYWIGNRFSEAKVITKPHDNVTKILYIDLLIAQEKCLTDLWSGQTVNIDVYNFLKEILDEKH